MKRYTYNKTLLAIALAVAAGYASQSALGDPHSGQSSKVVIIGGTTLDCGTSAANLVTSGGCLPVTGAAGELGDFTFAAMAPAAVSAASLAGYDTAVLNVHSPGMACNTNNLPASAKTDLVAFVGSGKKLIIYDSECSPQDYSWLPYPFTTANPGPRGGVGTLTIVENNLLSTFVGDPDCSGPGAADPHCINVSYLGGSTDAVGDMNVMTTFDPNWCLDMSGTNALNVTGPVHTYAKTGKDLGLLIYNGLDTDYLSTAFPGGTGSDLLRKIWVQELQQPFNPSKLPCGVPVVGVLLTPDTAENEVGTDHTVTATLTDLSNTPQAGIQVTFSVTSGPNVGAAGICSVNADCTTDANGNVSFTYTGVAGIGTDEIKACFNDQVGTQICSKAVTKDWIITNQSPICSSAHPSKKQLLRPNHKFVPIRILGVTDPDLDPVAITVTSIRQDEVVKSGHTAPDGKGVGTATAQVRAERIWQSNGRVYHIGYTAEDGRGGSCSAEVQVGVPLCYDPPMIGDDHDPCKLVDDGPIYDSTVR